MRCSYTKGAKAVLAVFILLILAFAVYLAVDWWPSHPFAELRREDVTGVTVRCDICSLSEPMKLPDGDVDTLVSLLNGITVYREDRGLTERDGSVNVMFELETADGTVFSVAADSGGLIVNGSVGYHADRKTAQAIGDLFWEWVDAARAERQ